MCLGSKDSGGSVRGTSSRLYLVRDSGFKFRVRESGLEVGLV